MWGKVLGALFGLALLKLPGLIIGLVLGHLADQWFTRKFAGWRGLAAMSAAEDEQALFMYTTFAVMGHLAKATGVVTKAHIEQANIFMQQLGLTMTQKKEAQAAFRDGKGVSFPLQAQVQEFYQCYRRRPDVLQLFIEIQLNTVCNGNKVLEGQRELLWQIAAILQMSRSGMEQLLRAYQARSSIPTPDNQTMEQRVAAAYQVLGCNSDVSDLQLKRAYRKLMSQHHPDKLMSQGVPTAMLEVAKQRSQDIQAAYELVKQHRVKNH